MQKIQLINKQKILNNMYTIIIIMLLMYIIIKITQISSINFKNENNLLSNTVFNFENKYYIALINETLPNQKSISKIKSLNNTLEDLVLKNILGFDIHDYSTYITATIPIINSISKNRNYKTISELSLDFNKIEQYDNEMEDVYIRGDQDEIFTIYSNDESDSVESSKIYALEQFKDINFLKQNMYIVDGNIDVTMKDFNIDYYMSSSLKVNLKSKEPKILIFHTHSQESFVDSRGAVGSRGGEEEDTIVGVGNELAKILHDKYNVSVIHHKGQYDVVDGNCHITGAYERVEPAIRDILKKYPSIEVVIDIHRDALPTKLITTINEKPTAKFMFFNGICRYKVNGEMQPIKGLENEYIDDNMAFSFRMQLKANELYGNLTRKIYLKAYRYSLNMLPKSLMVEVGSDKNTLQEAKNAMIPLAEILYQTIN